MRLRRAAVRATTRLPKRMLRRMAGDPMVIDGRTHDLQLQVIARQAAKRAGDIEPTVDAMREGLRALVERAYEHVALFRERMDQKGLRPDHVRCLEDIRKLPLYTKVDLRDTYPFGLFASPLDEVVRLHASSGTTGKPIVVGYTQEDMDVWTGVMIRTLTSCGHAIGERKANSWA